MAILTAGNGGAFATISAAVAASSSGDTIRIAPGLYRNDFPTIRHDLTLEAPSGTATLVATVAPPNGKAIITEGGPGVDVTLSGLDISGARVPDGNGAAIRYEGGTLTLDNVAIHHNQDGILAANDPSGTITITNSTFTDNGSGTGYTHGIYVNRIAELTIHHSTIQGTRVGHQVKSRAAATTITNSLLADGAGGTGSYLVDLPNGGTAVIAGNTLQKGPAAQNPIAISFGAEGSLHPGSSLAVSGNTLVNDRGGHTTAVRNTTGAVAEITANTLYGWTAQADGPARLAGTLIAPARPAIALPAPSDTPPHPPAPPRPEPEPAPDDLIPGLPALPPTPTLPAIPTLGGRLHDIWQLRELLALDAAAPQDRPPLG